MIRRLSALIAILVSSQPVHADSLSQPYQAMPGIDCVVNPHLEVEISSPIAGVIEELLVQRSQQVTVGQELVQMEASVERASVELARYRARAASGIGLSRVNVEFDELRKQRVESLLGEQNVSKEIVDQTERDYQLSNWNLKQAQELTQIRKLELKKAEEQLQQKLITAPFDGFVLDTFKNKGEYVDDQPIVRLAQLDPLVVEAIVPMEYFGSIKTGMRADILLEVLRKKDLSAEVIAVDRIGDAASSTFGVKLSMPNPDYQIPAGLKCILKFVQPGPGLADAVTDIPLTTELNSPSISLLADNTDSTEKLSVNALENNEVVQSDASLDLLPLELVSDIVVEELSENDEAPVLVLASASVPDSENQFIKDAASTVVVSETEETVEIVVPSEDIVDPDAPKSYMVLIQQPEGKEATQALVEKLRAAGIDDFQKINNGPTRRIISLGIFSKRNNADNRQQMLDKLGFESSTRKLYR